MSPEPVRSYLNSIESNHLPPSAKPIKSLEKCALKSFYINGPFANALSETVGNNEILKTLQLSWNSLNDSSLNKIVSKVPSSIREIDISGNKAISIKGYS